MHQRVLLEASYSIPASSACKSIVT